MHKRLISGVAAAVVAASTMVGAQNGTPINPNPKNTLTIGSTEPLEWLRLTITPGVNASPSANAFGPFN